MTWEEAVRWCLAEPSMAELARDAYFGDPFEAAERYRDSAEYVELRKLLPTTPGRALDLGAGNGIVSYALASDGWDVTAVEPDSSDLVGAGAIRQIAKQSGLHITVIEAFGEAIPIERANFDVVIARQVLHHARELPTFCMEMRRLSRPGASIITLRDHVISDRTQLQPFLDAHPLHRHYGGENAFTRRAYRNALEAAGLRIEREYRSFDSILNYAPHTPQSIGLALAAGSGVFAPLVRLGLSMPGAHYVMLRLLSIIDRRPGRLVSFHCVRTTR